MNLILLGTDFGEDAVKAQAKAAHIAKATGAKLHFLHVLEPVDDPDSQDPETQEFYRKLEESSKKKLDEATASLPDVETESSIAIGHRHPTILACAARLNADLIVLGSRPIEAESQRFGTSHRVAVTSHIPVLLVP